MRLVIAGLLLSFLGCAKTPPPRVPEWGNEQQKLLACLDLQDHVVDLYSNQYVKEHELTLSDVEYKAFRDGWAEELAKRGTFDRFEQTCFSSLTPDKYSCGMAAPTTGDLTTCMRFVGKSVSSSK